MTINKNDFHTGTGAGALDFSSGLNPLGPPENLRMAISRGVELLDRYPDAEKTVLRLALAEKHGVQTQNIALGNGSTAILFAAARISGKKTAVIPQPAREDFAAAAIAAGMQTVEVPASGRNDVGLDVAGLSRIVTGDQMVFLGAPNAVSGQGIDSGQLLALIAAHPGTFFVIDESCGNVSSPFALRAAATVNLLVVRSFSFLFAVPGLRLGYGCTASETSTLLRAVLPSRPVDALALTAGRALLEDHAYIERTVREVPLLRSKLMAELGKIPGLEVLASETFFLLVRITDGKWSAAELAARLEEEKIRVGKCDGVSGLSGNGAQFLRIAVRKARDNGRLVAQLSRLLARKNRKKTARKNFSIMLQGTCSNAGKSVLTAALCRIMLQDGFRVAPFKAQNISLNSYVTRDGLEMGRAQVVQAQACCLDPEVRMNPILVKLSAEAGSQVILNGRPVDSRTAARDSFRDVAWRAARQAYDKLAAEFDGIVLEGAGSPGEVNLKKQDIVNMRMARHAGAPVLLVGDIDRGGVFASFVGHMEVFYEWERNLVAGFIVNRFRGRQDLLTDALAYTERHTGRPVLGVVPYLRDPGLPEEDSVSFKDGLYERQAPTGEHIEIGLIDLPHISNFTDYEPFLGEPDVFLRVIKNAAELDAAGNRLAAIMLPGSKNVMHDMDYLLQTGLADRILRLAADGGTEVVGICGGFQMLGAIIADPFGLESAGHEMRGLGLLDMTTVLEKDKTLKRRIAIHADSGLEVHGYEIHHGRSLAKGRRMLDHEEGERICAGTDDGMIWGSYLHGIFDADPFRRWYLDRLRRRRGFSPLGAVRYTYNLETALDRLADTVRQGLDMERIYRLLGI